MFTIRCAIRSVLSLSGKECSQLPFKQLIPSTFIHTTPASYDWNVIHLCKPKSLHNRLWRKVQYPEKYTIEPLPVKNLGGRDPETGNILVCLKFLYWQF